MSNEAADIAEFMKVAKGKETGVKEAYKKSLRGAVPGNKDDDSSDPASLVQYVRAKGGFIPTGPTVSTLPPDVYTIRATSSGPFFEPQHIVTDSLLRLPDSKSDFVVKEIESFWPKKSQFTKYGFAHKRGFLLFGPPGGGKTCTVAIVIKQLVDLGGIVILGNSCAPNIVGIALREIRQIEPERPVIVVLEDMDTIIDQHGESDTLSLLDGENSIDNVVYLATTNYPERLDARLLNRPSRFDRIVKIDMPTKDARLLYLKSRNLELPESTLVEWAEKTKDFSIAHLKELVIGVFCFGGNLEDEIKRLRGMAKTPRSDEPKERAGFGVAKGYGDEGYSEAVPCPEDPAYRTARE